MKNYTREVFVIFKWLLFMSFVLDSKILFFLIFVTGCTNNQNLFEGSLAPDPATRFGMPTPDYADRRFGFGDENPEFGELIEIKDSEINPVKITYNVEDCNESDKSGPIVLEGSGNKVDWVQHISTYCSLTDEVKVALIKIRKSEYVVKAITPDTNEVSKCSCPVKITGSLTGFEDGEYSLSFEYANNYSDDNYFLGKYFFEISLQDKESKIVFNEKLPDSVENGYRERCTIDKNEVFLSFSDERDYYSFGLSVVFGDSNSSVGFDIKDWNKNNKADWIRQSESTKGSRDSELIEFYHGDDYFQYVKSQNENSINLVGLHEIQDNEFGVVKNNKAVSFYPVKDKYLNALFSLGDNFFESRKNFEKKFCEKFKKEISSVITRRIKDMPQDWHDE